MAKGKKKAAAKPAVHINPGMEELRLTVNSQGWKNVVEPTLAQNVMRALNSLASLKRPEGETEDFLRGKIAAWREMSVLFPQEIAKYDAKRFAAVDDQPPETPVGSPYEEDTLSQDEQDEMEN